MESKRTGVGGAVLTEEGTLGLFSIQRYRGTHLRRDTVIPQWFQASKAAAASDGHAVHCCVTAVICQLSRLKRIPRYRFLTVDQYARITSLLHDTASKQLLRYERAGLLGFLGNTGIRGYGKTPKVYFLTRKGFELLTRESDIPPQLLGSHKEIKVESLNLSHFVARKI